MKKEDQNTENKQLLKTPVSGSCFGIRAECRTRKIRVILYAGWTEEQAKNFKATPAIKKLYRYFRMVNVNNYR